MIDSRPKVLFIAPLPPPVHGASMVGEVLRGSDAVRSSFDGDWVNLSVSSSVSEIGRFSFGKPFRVLGLYLKVLARLIGRRYDCAYIALTCHGTGFLKDAPVALMCKAAGIPLVIHQHNKGMSGDAGRKVFGPLLKAVYRDSKVMLLSRRLFRDISGIVSEDQVMICPNGIRDAQPVHVHDWDGEIRAVFLSNLLVSKGVYDLVDAIAILKKRGVPVRCAVAGAYSSEITRGDFDCYVRGSGAEGLVECLGPLYGQQKESLWETPCIFVLPTTYANECQPLVVLEAMQHGIPVIATDEGGICDMVIDGETGLVVGRNDPSDLADKIQYLITRRDVCRDMGAAGRRLYEERFTQDIFISRFCGCIQSAIEK